MPHFQPQGMTDRPTSLLHGTRGQSWWTNDVTDRIDVRHGCAAVLIDFQEPRGSTRQTRRSDIELGDIGDTPQSAQQLFTANSGAVCQRSHNGREPVPGHIEDALLSYKAPAMRFKTAHKALGEFSIHKTQRPLIAVDDGDLHPQSG